jgi:hypothetical protein
MVSRLTIFAVTASAALASIASSSAGAAVFIATFNGPSLAGSATLTTQDFLSPVDSVDASNQPAIRQGYLVTGITGEVNNVVITGLIPADTLGSNNNYIFSDLPLVDAYGLSFKFGAEEANLFYNFREYKLSTTSNIRGESVILTISPAVAVPEPASWALMIGGFGMVGGAMRRRRSVSTKVSFA